MLCDRLVCGISDQRIQRHLLVEPDLSFDKALELSLAAEAAEWNTRELDTGMQRTSVHKLSGQGERPRKEGGAQSLQCYRCDGKHRPNQCRFKDSACHNCGKKGHLAKVCRSRRLGESVQRREPKRQQEQTHLIEEATPDPADTTAAYSLFAVTDQQSTALPLLAGMRVNNVQLQMEVDTGASVSLISEDI